MALAAAIAAIASHPRGIDLNDEPVQITSREELIYLLNNAAELEHSACVTYLFAAFSLKSGVDEGLTAEQAATVVGWKRAIFTIATQEMAHLTLVTNLLNSIGGAPHLAPPELPHHPRYAPEIRIELTPLNEETIERFLYIERPEGLSIEKLAGDIHLGRLSRIWMPAPSIAPVVEPFLSIGQLYRDIEAGFRHLSRKLGQDRLFIGEHRLQATAEQFRMPELMRVFDLESALAAIDRIVVEGEGQRNNWRSAHFGRFVSMLDSFRSLRRDDPRFAPARPVVANPSSHPDEGRESYAGLTRIENPSTCRVADLFDACYEMMLHLLERLFAQAGESKRDLDRLAGVAIGMMMSTITPLGELLTKLPVSESLPDRTAGPPFAASTRTAVTVHKPAAWAALRERMIELADESASIALAMEEARVTAAVEKSLRGFADQLRLEGQG
jgi:hypothetical protein